MAFKSILTFSRILEVELFELRYPEPGYNHFPPIFCHFSLSKWEGHRLFNNLAKGRVCWSLLQP